MASNHPGHVSMHDVAVAAGVSSQTVSRVANGGKLVRPETREKVIDAMHQMGYRPNFAARALKRGQFKAIGVVMFDILAAGNILTLDGITHAAKERGYAVTLSMISGNDEPSLSATFQRVKELPIDGIVIVLEKMMDDLKTFVAPPDMPITVITSATIPGLSTIDTDQYKCSEKIVDYFLQHGHENVYFISGPEDSVANHYREAGWRETLERCGKEPPKVLHGDWTADSGYAAGIALAQTPDCTAIYAANDSMANGVIKALEDSGKRIPEDISIIGVDNSLQDIVPKLTLTTVKQDFRQVGEHAVVKTIEAIESGKIFSPTHELLPPHLIERSSVKTLNTAAITRK